MINKVKIYSKIPKQSYQNSVYIMSQYLGTKIAQMGAFKCVRTSNAGPSLITIQNWRGYSG